MSQVTNAESETYGTWLDIVADVKPWLQIPSTDTTRDPALRLIVDMVCTHLQNFLGRPVAAKQFTRRFDGWSNWNGTYIMLPRFPVLEVVQVIEYQGLSSPHVLSESTPTAQTDGFQLTPQTGRLTRVFPGNVPKPWFPGSRNIEVSWVAGFNPVPPDIQVSALEMIAGWFEHSQQQNAIRNPGAGGGQAEPEPNTGMFAGVPPHIASLLSPYLSIGMG